MPRKTLPAWMFRWAASQELAPVTVYQALATVGILAKGRSAAKETPAVKAGAAGACGSPARFRRAPGLGAIDGY